MRWQDEIGGLQRARRQVAPLTEAPEPVALPALDELLRLLHQAGTPEFAARLVGWCDAVDRALAEPR